MIGGTSRLCMQHIYPKMETKVNICFSFLFFPPPSNTALIPLTHILGLETIAAHFAEPEKESIVDNTIYFDYKVKESPFTVFTILSVMMRMEEEDEEEKEQGLEEAEWRERQSDFVRMSRFLLRSILDVVTVLVDLDTWLWVQLQALNTRL